MTMLALPVQALGRAPAWALNYTRTASDTAETLWLLNRRDHLRAVENRPAPQGGSPPTSVSRWMDLRLSLARPVRCGPGAWRKPATGSGRPAWVLEEQGARPLRAIADFDQALMHARAGQHPAGAARHWTRNQAQFQRIGMTDAVAAPGPTQLDGTL